MKIKKIVLALALVVALNASCVVFAAEKPVGGTVILNIVGPFDPPPQ